MPASEDGEVSGQDDDGMSASDNEAPESVDQHDPSKNSQNRNPTGKNQYEGRPSRDCPQLRKYLEEYHRRGVVNNRRIAELLWADHGLRLGARTIGRRRRDWNLTSSGPTTKALVDTVKRQLIMDQLSKAPNRRLGPRRVKENIAYDTGIHLTRDYISETMHTVDASGFIYRHSASKKPSRTPLAVPGPHYEWSGDGHDKLNKIGFPIYGVRDVWSGKWLGLWTVPNNRFKVVAAYLYLSLVYQLEGMPVQSTTDCGSETSLMYGFANALREHFSPQLSLGEFPAHRFLRSVHNTTIERGWLRLRLEFGDNAVIAYEAGSAVFNAMDPGQSELVQWVWSKAIQAGLDDVRDRFNNHRVRYDAKKVLPSGTTPNIAMSLPQQFGGTNCLLPVDKGLVAKLMEDIGGKALVQFTSTDFALSAEAVYREIGTPALTVWTAWTIFSQMLPLM